jgi:hypothetical protein
MHPWGRIEPESTRSKVSGPRPHGVRKDTARRKDVKARTHLCRTMGGIGEGGRREGRSYRAYGTHTAYEPHGTGGGACATPGLPGRFSS